MHQQTREGLPSWVDGWTLEPIRSLVSHKGIRAENNWEYRNIWGRPCLLPYSEVKVNGKMITSPQISMSCIWYSCVPQGSTVFGRLLSGSETFKSWSLEEGLRSLEKQAQKQASAPSQHDLGSTSLGVPVLGSL